MGWGYVKNVKKAFLRGDYIFQMYIFKSEMVTRNLSIELGGEFDEMIQEIHFTNGYFTGSPRKEKVEEKTSTPYHY
ncbi:hypothetical protein DNU06_05445 [Putridiphycobacter roseus]|uniref:Uncharacterized protein n=2 Tax=Putridiphycobacter roseus TaxID=2219161 RepID=A0A2W1N4R5_9FLAO|nr:hypothetical protein DNU06_05445 [Putridiphycobacter roseus]